jgi:glycosyltransferase involved in cell wall biosynthesis
MIIGIDAREIQFGVHTGIGRALEVFLEYFQGLCDDNRIILFSAEPLRPFQNRRISNVVKKEVVTFYWDQVSLVGLIKKYNVDLFYSPYYKIPMFCPCPAINAILDLMYLYFEPYKKAMPFASRLYYRAVGTIMARRAKAIFTCSEFSKKDVADYYRVNPEKVKVIHLGLDCAYHPVTDRRKIEQVKSKYNIEGDYVLYVGNVKQHKNIETLLQSFSMVSTEFDHVKLVLSTPKDEHLRRIEHLIDPKTMVVTGEVCLEDQVILYSGAKLFLITSLYEGFGFPPLEAMACGIPVVSSDSGSLPEVIGTAGTLVDGRNPQQIARRVLEILRSPELRLTMAKAGIERAREFTKEKYSADLYQLFLECVRK